MTPIKYIGLFNPKLQYPFISGHSKRGPPLHNSIFLQPDPGATPPNPPSRLSRVGGSKVQILEDLRILDAKGKSDPKIAIDFFDSWWVFIVIFIPWDPNFCK